MTAGVPFWQVRQLVSCAICDVPVSHQHELDGDIVCTSCYLHARGRGELDGIGFALTLMLDRNVCAYCGEFARDEEQLPAQSSEDPLWTVLQCEECCDLVRGESLRTFEEKRLHIRHELSWRYAGVVDAPEWDRDEIEEMGRGLRASVELAEQARKIVHARLQFTFDQLVGK